LAVIGYLLGAAAFPYPASGGWFKAFQEAEGRIQETVGELTADQDSGN
jgi:hypothetical protein